MFRPLSYIEQIIAQRLTTTKPAGERVRELEKLLDVAKLTPKQLQAIHEELAEIKKRFPNGFKK